jgi:hypothetical protein
MDVGPVGGDNAARHAREVGRILDCSGMFTFLVIIVVVILIVTRASQSRATRTGAHRLGQQPPQACPACGEAHPAYAQFCRRCGRRLP